MTLALIAIIPTSLLSILAQTGIGTYTSPQLVTSTGQAVSKTLDEMVAWNLDAHVMGTFTSPTHPVRAPVPVLNSHFFRGIRVPDAKL